MIREGDWWREKGRKRWEGRARRGFMGGKGEVGRLARSRAIKVTDAGRIQFPYKYLRQDAYI